MSNNTFDMMIGGALVVLNVHPIQEEGHNLRERVEAAQGLDKRFWAAVQCLMDRDEENLSWDWEGDSRVLTTNGGCFSGRQVRWDEESGVVVTTPATPDGSWTAFQAPDWVSAMLSHRHEDCRFWEWLEARSDEELAALQVVRTRQTWGLHAHVSHDVCAPDESSQWELIDKIRRHDLCPLPGDFTEEEMERHDALIDSICG